VANAPKMYSTKFNLWFVGFLPLPSVCTWKDTEIDRREIGRDRTGWIYLARVGNGGMLLCVRLRTFGFHKTGEFYQLSEYLLWHLGVML